VGDGRVGLYVANLQRIVRESKATLAQSQEMLDNPEHAALISKALTASVLKVPTSITPRRHPP
jgi:hypothetical protein